MRIFAGCLLLGACTSAPARPPSDGAAVMADAPVMVMPGVDGGPEYHDPPPGTPVARLMASPVDFDFGNVNTGTARQNPVTITNVGDAQSAPLQAMLSPGADLKLTTNCTGLRLRPGETCVVTATFEPKGAGAQAASGSVTDGAGTSFGVVMFMVRGTGRLAPDAGPDVAPPPRLDAAPGTEAGAPPKDASPTPDVGRDVAPDVAPKPDTTLMPDAGASADQGSSG